MSSSSLSSDESSDFESSVVYSLKTFTTLSDSLEIAVFMGRKYLSQHAGKHTSITNGNIKLRDNFSQLLILEVTGNEDLITLNYHPRTWNYFIGKPFGTTQYYPDDFDTTSIAWTNLPVSSHVVRSVLDEMMTFNNEDGIVTTYFDDSRPRVDPVVCVNVLNLFYHHGYDDWQSLEATQSYVISVLEKRSYLSGTRYYASPEPFLFFLSRLVASEPAQPLRERIISVLQERIRERAGMPGDAMELGMRILASISAEVGWSNVGSQSIWDKDILKLRELQSEDGGWKTGWLCRYGKTGVLIGNRGLTTALAVKALEITNGL